MVAGKSKAGEPVSEARERLAAAIVAAVEADVLQAEEQAALERAKEMVRKAEADLAAAASDVATARQALTDGMLVAVKSGGAASVSDGALAAARRRQDEARDVLDAARNALSTVAAQHRPNGAAQRAAERLNAAAADVVRPMIESTIDEAMRAHRDWVLARGRLHFLHRICFPEVLATQESQRVLHVANGDTVDADPGLSDMEGRWLEAFDALKRDAAAALPWEA